MCNLLSAFIVVVVVVIWVGAEFFKARRMDRATLNSFSGAAMMWSNFIKQNK